ncbi:MAG: LLM class flavin-dependent oxidoreductase [Burkholderiales bacterium]|nr:LLM class flavin-dependent oxidoreductase [Burkholderiales bacterium]
MAVHWRRQPLSKIVELIDASERLDYSYLWITNEKFFHDMYVTAAMAAARTKRIKIGTFISDPYSLHPAMTAMAVATLDEVSGGRAVLCMGAGGTGFAEMGLNRSRPAVAIREAITVIGGMFRGEVVDHHGEFVEFTRGSLGFPARPGIPVYVASRGDHVYRTAGQMADGAMIATFAEPEGIDHAKKMIAEGATRAGRKLRDFTLISRIDTCIHPVRAIAYRAVKPNIAVCLWSSYPDREFVHRLGLSVPEELEALIARRDYGLIYECGELVPDEFVPRFAWAGTIEDVSQQVRRVVTEAGITHLTIMPIPCGDRSEVDIATTFARDVRAAVEKSIA